MRARMIAVAIGGLLGATPLAAQTPMFEASTAFITGPQSGEVILADLNRDGRLDLVVQHLAQRRVAMQFGDGKGGFGSAAGTSLALAFEPGAIALGDLDGDGRFDMIIASRDRAEKRDYVHVFRGAEAGGFTPVVRREIAISDVGYKPTLFLRDLDQDGQVDIAVLDARRTELVVLYGDGDGDFTLARVPLEAGFLYRTIGFGDIDGDGTLDLVTASLTSEREPDRVAVRYGDSPRGFGAPRPLQVSTLPQPYLRAIEDLDADGRPDLVFGHADSALLSVLLNDGRGGFAAAPGSPYPIGGEAWAVATADADRDGRIDLFVATVNTISVLLARSAGFASAPGSPFVVRRGAYTLAVGDVDNDGKSDIVASSFEDETATPLFGR